MRLHEVPLELNYPLWRARNPLLGASQVMDDRQQKRRYLSR